MKKLSLLLLLLPAVLVASAQHTRFNFYSAYVFDDGFDFYNSANNYYAGQLSGGYQIGAGIEYLADASYGVELMYLYKSSDAPSHFKFGSLTTETTETFHVTQQYIMLCGNRYMHTANQKVEGYGGFMFGMVIGDVDAPTTGGHSSNTNFAWGARLGANIWATNKIALKLQAQILSATRATGGELYFGSWGPVALPDYSTLWQFGLGGGLSLRLGK